MSDAPLATVPGAGQPWLFQWLRLRLLANGFRDLVRSSPLRLVTIILSVVIVWGTALGLSAWALLFLVWNNIPQALIGLLLDVMFLTVALLLVFSTGLILYGALFKGAEAAFLLSQPARADQVFGYKFQSAVGLSSLAFLWLGSPLLLVYGYVFGASWLYYLLLPAFVFGFVLVFGSFGALMALLVVRFLPNQRRTFLIVNVIMLVNVLGVIVYTLVQAAVTTGADPLQALLGAFSFARNPILPNHWVTRGVQSAAWGDWEEALYHLALLWTNGLLLYVATAWAAGRLYRGAYDRLTTGGDWAGAGARPRAGGARRSAWGWLDAAVAACFFFTDAQTRALVVKDFRTLRREPVQWVQIVIFVVLMVLYFAIMRGFYEADIGKPYQNGVSLLNLSVTGLLMCAYTGRFIYPLLSLEGRKFWLLGLLPLNRDRLLWAKFAYSAVSMLLPSLVLIVVSDRLLGMSWLVVALHALAMVALALGLSGLSVGLGAALPNFKETNPSKIAVGFGGTLNLILGLALLVCVVGLVAGPYHFYAAAPPEKAVEDPLTSWWLYAGVLLGVGAGVAALVLPMRLGSLKLRRMEF